MEQFQRNEIQETKLLECSNNVTKMSAFFTTTVVRPSWVMKTVHARDLKK
uniref:Uncharacterized protein n=1 Tax=Arion vulgaris TaxID=1028688 RepID=A0A0B7A0J9_9EUPU